jgi:hypothetical protein
VSVKPADYLIAISVEDNIYMNWQLELMVHSLMQRAMKNKKNEFIVKPENICAVVHSNKPGLSKYFTSITKEYGIKHIRTSNFGRDDVHSFFERGSTTQRSYVNKNKTCCFGAIYSEGLHEEYKYTLLSDADMFAFEYLNFNKFPSRKSAIAEHWITDHPVIDRFPNAGFDNKGIDLKKLMKAMGVPKENIRNYVPGCCLIWLKKEDFSKELVNAIPGYNDIIRGVCQVTRQGDDWCAECPSYSLALAHYGIKTDLIWEPEFCHANGYGNIDYDKEVPKGSLIHYGYAECWKGTGFTKWQYTNKNPFDEPKMLEHNIEYAAHDVGRHFFYQAHDVATNVDIDRSMDLDKTTQKKVVIDLNELCPISKPPTKEDMVPLKDYDSVYTSLKSYLEVSEQRTIALINTEEVTYVADCDILVTQSLVRMEHEFLPLTPKVVRFNIIDANGEEGVKAKEILEKFGYRVFETKQYVMGITPALIKNLMDLVF